MSDPEDVAKGLMALLPINSDMECSYCVTLQCLEPPKDGVHRDAWGAQTCLWGASYDGVRELLEIPADKNKAQRGRVVIRFISLREIVSITGRSRGSMQRWLDKAGVSKTRFGTSAISYNRIEFFKWLASRVKEVGA